MKYFLLVLACICATVHGGWENVTVSGTAPTARSGHTAVANGANVIIFGGNAGSVTNTISRFNAQNNQWQTQSTSGTAPAARELHSAVAYNGNMYIFGGRNGNTYYNNFFRMQFSNGAWSSLSNTNGPSARAGHSAAVTSGGMMFVFGGTTGGTTYLNDVYRYDIGQNTWAVINAGGTKPAARMNHVAVITANSIMYIFGGYDGTAVRGDLAKFDTVSNNWVAVSPAGTAPAARQRASAVFVPNPLEAIVIFGGAGANGKLNDVAKYEPLSDAWVPTPVVGSAPSGRDGHTMTYANSKLIIFGGSTTAASNQILVYNPIDCRNTQDCNDNFGCTVDSCRVGSCQRANAPAGTSCNDNIFCNGQDTCDANGNCQHSGDPCVGGSICNNMCNETAANCQSPPTTPCDDGLFCTKNDFCSGGICVGTGNTCDQYDFCNQTCDENTKSCARAAGIPCDDGSACTLTDTCDGSGKCVGSNVPCDETDPCRRCTDLNGTFVCVSPAGSPCDNGVFCDGTEQCDGFGTCVSTGNPCTNCPSGCDEAGGFCVCGTASTGPVVDSNSGVETLMANVMLICVALALMFI